MGVPVLDKGKADSSFKDIGITLTTIFMACTLVGLSYIAYRQTTVPGGSLLILPRSYDICNLVPSATIKTNMFNIAPSFWMAHVIFFITYLITNAVILYNTAATNATNQDKIRYRKNQVATAVAVTIIVTLFLIYGRLQTGCESMMGILVAILAIVPLGIGWFYFAKVCGVGNSDIFGIAGNMFTSSSPTTASQVCISNSS